MFIPVVIFPTEKQGGQGKASTKSGGDGLTKKECWLSETFQSRIVSAVSTFDAKVWNSFASCHCARSSTFERIE